MFLIICLVFAAFSIGMIGAMMAGVFDKKAPSLPTKQFEAPTTEIGVNIPVLFGSRMISDARIAWWGDLKIKKVKVNAASKK